MSIFRNLRSHLLWLILALYPMSHLPALALGSFSLSVVQFLQLATLITGGIGLIVSADQRRRHNRLLMKYSPVSLSLGVLLALVVLSQLRVPDGRQGLYATLLLVSGAGFGTILIMWLDELKPKWARVERWLIAAGLAVSGFAVLQFIGDNLELPRSLTQILPTTHWDQIDFSRANGLSVEPQFFTTVLLLPAVLLNLRATRRLTPGMFACFVLIDIALLLASSRAGFLAVAAVAACWSVYWLRKKQYKVLGARILAAAAAFCVVIGLMAWSGSLPGHKGAGWVASRYVEQASGGLIPLQSAKFKDKTATPSGDNSPKGKDEIGVVEESAIGRLETYRTALKIWNLDWKHRLFGVGWGGFGAAAAELEPGHHKPNSIVNNQPLQFLVELGLVGLIAAAAFAVAVARAAVGEWRKPDVVALSLLLGLAVQLTFYSALHLPQLWLSLALLLYFSQGGKLKNA
jgi:hypothetical protein